VVSRRDDFRGILATKWPPPVIQSFILVPYSYPAAVFPNLPALIHSKILKNAVYEEAVSEFVELFMAVCTTEKRFVTFLMIFILAKALAPTHGLAEPNAEHRC
jgi:hypothetical protein